MADTYFISFHIVDRVTLKGTYAERYDALIEALLDLSLGGWDETTSFIVFISDSTPAQIIEAIRNVIDARYDIALLGMTEFKPLWLIGAAKRGTDLLNLAPALKAA